MTQPMAMLAKARTIPFVQAHQVWAISFSAGPSRSRSISSTSSSSSGDAKVGAPTRPAGKGLLADGGPTSSSRRRSSTPSRPERTHRRVPVNHGQLFSEWVETEGKQFQRPIEGKTNWLGETTPFPLNPSFQPKPPIADVAKKRIYKAYVDNLQQKEATDEVVVRALSLKFGIAMDRIKAVIRLQELELKWIEEGRVPQTDMLANMESHLGVKPPGRLWKGVESVEPLTHIDGPKARVFEINDLEKGEKPIFLPLLANVADRKIPFHYSPPPINEPKEILVRRTGRPSTLFVDISGTKEGEELEKTYKMPRKNRKRMERRLEAESVLQKKDEVSSSTID